MTVRRILLADADAFYVSVARLVDPDGAGKAPLLIVGGSAEHRGVVMSASYEARSFGVRSAMPMARAMRLCPDALVVPVPWEACAEKGRAIRKILERFTPAVEQASSDEFYLDLTGTERLYHDERLAVTAGRIRDTVRAEVGLTLSIGGGTSKLVAKLAAGVAKPQPNTAAPGVCVVEPGVEEAFVRRLALADLPGIGPRAQERLAGIGLRAVADVQPLDRAALVRRLGEREGNWLFDRVRGIDDSPVEPHGEPKSISRDETFPVDIDDDEALARRLGERVDDATADLRDGGHMARTVTVKIRDADFTTRQASRTLAQPVLSDRAVYAVARELLGRLRAARRVPARLLGVSLSQLVRADARPQLSLLGPAPRGEGSSGETERDRVLAQVIDEVRERFGPRALGRGRAGPLER